MQISFFTWNFSTKWSLTIHASIRCLSISNKWVWWWGGWATVDKSFIHSASFTSQCQVLLRVCFYSPTIPASGRWPRCAIFVMMKSFAFIRKVLCKYALAKTEIILTTLHAVCDGGSVAQVQQLRKCLDGRLCSCYREAMSFSNNCMSSFQAQE